MNEEESILNSVKKLLGIGVEDTSFNTDLIIHINSALSSLCQLGVGDSNGFCISDETATWVDFVGDKVALIGMLRMYVYLKTRLVFDPPSSSFVLESIKQSISEYEWRINSAVDY